MSTRPDTLAPRRPPVVLPQETRTLFVVGKGGVGKSTVSHLLAQLLATPGKRILLVRMDQPERGDRWIPALPEGVSTIDLDGEGALTEYLALNLPSRRLHRRIVRSRLYKRFVAVAPGLKELMMVGKVCDAERLVEPGGQPVWDHIVVDTPPTGHGLQILRMPSTALETFGPGLVRREALRLLAGLRDPRRTAIVPVTVAEELPVNETLEMVSSLRLELDLPLSVLFVNRLHRAKVTAEALPEALPEAGTRVQEALARGRLEAGWTAVNRTHLARLRAALELPLIELPFRFTHVLDEPDLAELARLAARQLERLSRVDGGRS